MARVREAWCSVNDISFIHKIMYVNINLFNSSLLRGLWFVRNLQTTKLLYFLKGENMKCCYCGFISANELINMEL